MGVVLYFTLCCTLGVTPSRPTLRMEGLGRSRIPSLPAARNSILIGLDGQVTPRRMEDVMDPGCSQPLGPSHNLPDRPVASLCTFSSLGPRPPPAPSRHRPPPGNPPTSAPRDGDDSLCKRQVQDARPPQRRSSTHCLPSTWCSLGETEHLATSQHPQSTTDDDLGRQLAEGRRHDRVGPHPALARSRPPCRNVGNGSQSLLQPRPGRRAILDPPAAPGIRKRHSELWPWMSFRTHPCARDTPLLRIVGTSTPRQPRNSVPHTLPAGPQGVPTDHMAP